MNILVDFLVAFKNVVVAILVSWIRFLISRKQKCVKGEIVLVTGAGSGLGQAIAVEFAKLGSLLVLWDIDNEGLNKTAKMISEVGGLCHMYVCDVSDREQVKLVSRQVKIDVGDVTILVNNAGVVAGRKVLELTDDQIERTFGVNLLAHIWSESVWRYPEWNDVDLKSKTTKEFLPSMLENNHGHIVNMGSSCGLVGVSHLSDYSASKFGVTGFTQTLNYEIHFSGHDGVYTTLVCASHVKTTMFSGCEMACPSILPSMDIKPTINRIMQAILTNQQEVYIPRVIYLFAVLKQMLPSSAMYEIIKFFKAEKFMDSFTGNMGDKHVEDKSN